jgi:hypothetical protein
MRRALLLPLFLSFLLGFFALPARAAEEKKGPLEKPGVLEEETVLLTERLSANYDALVVRDFTADGAEYLRAGEEDREKIERMKPVLVSNVADSAVAEIKARTKFASVTRGGEAKGRTAVLEGKFTEFNVGSRALKFFVGFGAGKAYLKVSGRLLDGATGKELASFVDSETGYMGAVGMQSFEDLFPNQARGIGEHLSEFVQKLY